MHAGQRPHTWDAAAGADDDPAVDLLAQDGVGAAHVARAFRRDRGRLDAEAELAQGLGRIQYALVAGPPPLLQR